jgi:hypothetical protein
MVDPHVTHGRARAVWVLAAVAALAFTAACGSDGSSPTPPPTAAASLIHAPDLDAEAAAPAAPQGKPLLTLTGRIGTTNDEGALRLDRAELDRLGLLAMTVNDPWARQRVPLQGIWLRDLIALARPQDGATSLHLRAYDDYQVDLELSDVRAQGIFLATRTGAGTDLPIEEGGPTRVVFTDDLATRFSPDLWIWNIESIEVR